MASVLALGTFPQWAQAQIATDRPDFVESSLTVPHGAWQLETSLGWLNDESIDVFSTPTLVRWGFLPALEARLETRVSVPEDPQLTGALGAAMIARDRLEEEDG